ncbi:MAG: hypothetical protein R2747_00710 [Pyrinomonadaceae bacterium]
MREKIKAIGKHLKINVAGKARHFPRNVQLLGNAAFRHWRKIGPLLAVFLLPLFLLPSGCQKVNYIYIGDVINGYVWKGEEFENLRYEPLDSGNGPLDIRAARNFWLKRGEKMIVKVDTFEAHWEKEGEMCSFGSNVSTEECQICDYCGSPNTDGEPPCLTAEPDASGQFPFRIVADSGFIPTENPTNILDMYGPQILGGCNRPNKPLPIFEPTQSGLYRTMPVRPEFMIKSETQGETKIQIVDPGPDSARTVAFQLTGQMIDNTSYWTWATPGDSLWMENFSSNLRVTEVRLYRGVCADGSAQGVQCGLPDDKIPVKPSRLLFLPGFQNTVSGYPGEAQHRCYGDPAGATDNSIGVLNCRETYNSAPTGQRDVTPTYEVIPDRSDEKMTWFIEFNTNEGGDADLNAPGFQPMPTDARLIVEFTVAAI